MPASITTEPADFRAIFRELPGLYLLLSPDLTIVAASDAYLRATRKDEQIIGQPLFAAFPDSGANQQAGARALRQSFARVLANGKADGMAPLRYDLVGADGGVEVRFWSPINAPVFGEDGELRWLVHRVSDVTSAVQEAAPQARIFELESELLDTAQRLAQSNAALRQSEARLRLALDIGGMAVWQFLIADGLPTITPELNRLIGFSSDHATTLEEVRAGFVDEDQTIRHAAIRAWESGARVFEHQFRYRRHGDGRFVWLHLRAEIICDAGGQPREVLGVLEDVTERVTVEDRQRTLINELNHRVKNNLALAQSIAVRTFRGEGCETALSRFIDRLIGLAATHDLLTRTDWQGADILEVIEGSLRGLGVSAGRRTLHGPQTRLSPDMAVSLSLALHELGTNAIKYGALSNDAGHIELSWSLQPGRLSIVWQETGGPTVAEPRRRGFGSQLLSRIFTSLGGSTTLEYHPRGLICRMQCELK